MFAKHPKIAKEFSEHTPSIKELPEHSSKEKSSDIKKLRMKKTLKG